MEVLISDLEISKPVEKELKNITRTDLKQEAEEVLEEVKLYTVKEEDQLKSGESENLVVNETMYCEEERELLLSHDGIKQNKIQFEECELNSTRNGSVDSEHSADESKIGKTTVEPQVRKELVILLEKLDYSTLAKPASNQYSYPRKVCEHCGLTFAYEFRLARHRVKEHGSTEVPMLTRLPPKKTFPRDFHCDQCKKSYRYQTELAKHRAKIHGCGEVPSSSGPKKFLKHICKHCGKEYGPWAALVYHLKSIHGEIVDESQVVRCITCRAKFTSSKEMEEHVCYRRAGNKKDRRFKCDLCDNAYFTKNGLEGHFSVHPEYQHCKCGQCSMGFFNERELDKHMRFKHHVEGSFECETCGKQLKTQDGLTRHLENHANDRQLFCCEHCGKKYRNHAQFRAHKYHVHGEHVSEIVHVKPMLPCTICDKVFKGRNALFSHMQVHNSDRRFKCSFASCDKSFKTSSNKKVHEQSHTKDYRHKCKFCKYGSTERFRVVKHEQQEHNFDQFSIEDGSSSSIGAKEAAQ